MVKNEWKEKYKSILYSRKQLNRYDFTKDDCDFDGFYRDIFSFFKDCLDLRDWLIECGLEEKSTRDYVKSNEPLETCSALANTSKHLKLNDKRYKNRHYRLYFGRPDGVCFDSSTGASTFTATPGKDLPEYATVKPGECIIGIGDPNNKFINMFELADDCIASWDAYLKKNGLNPPIK